MTLAWNSCRVGSLWINRFPLSWGACEVWCPILFAGDLAVLGPLQKMSALLPSTVSDTVKMKEAQRVADDFAAQAVEQNPARNKKMYLCCDKTTELLLPLPFKIRFNAVEAKGPRPHQTTTSLCEGGSAGCHAHTQSCRPRLPGVRKAAEAPRPEEWRDPFDGCIFGAHAVAYGDRGGPMGRSPS